MSNIFKSNSRFSSLLEENDEPKGQISNNKKTKNTSKSSEDEKKHRFKDDRGYSERRFKEEHEYKLKDKEKMRQHLEKELDEKNFPILTLNVKENTSSSEKISTTRFIDKLTTIAVEKNDINTNEDYIPLGWLTMRKDKKTNKTIMKYGDSTYLNNPDCSILKAIEKLVYLHEKRSEEYIHLWGEDEYEKMFMFPNHDYDYFERLDQLQEEEFEQLSINNTEIHDSYNDDYHNY